MRTLHPDFEKILISEQELRDRVAEMGREITRDYQGAPVVVVSVLRGAAIFMADLVREVDLPIEMDYMAVSSYGSGVESSGVVTFQKDITLDVRGKHVIIAEDIIDSGLTLQRVIGHIEASGPASVEVAALLRKQRAGQADIAARYVGFDIPDEFVVGYGLDYAERYRNTPYVAVLKPSVYGE